MNKNILDIDKRINMNSIQGSASQAGFYYQNSVAASKIIECLFFNSDITSIRLENYDKGNHIDDIIIYRATKTEYIQVKWSNDENNSFTLYNLLNQQTDKKSIFKQLSEGYTSVKSSSSDFSITLFTTKRESNHKRPSEGISYGLADVRTNIIEPLKIAKDDYKLLPHYSDYKDVLEIIQNECQLDQVSFNDFLQKLEFKFSQESREQIQNATKSKLKNIGIETSLFEILIDNVVQWSITGEQITKDVVLRQLGIADRFEDKISQYFRTVDEKYYVPNHAFLSKLRTSLEELDGGYIFVEGLPGIGKSTTITKYFESQQEMIIEYYCFVPDDKTYGALRHNSYYFLKSLCIAIEKQFPDIDFPHKYSERYEEKLSAYIDKLGTIKRRVIFFIDGLDHVHRDIAFQGSSLLNHIKGELPDGVFFILSSQYEAVLSHSVAVSISSDERRHIIVSRFSQPEIEQYLSNKGIRTSGIIDQIERISCGIPLYLHYISEMLLKIEVGGYANLLERLPALQDGEMRSYHEYLFQQIDGDELSKWILAILALRKETSTIDAITDILELAGERRTLTEISSFINHFSHLLKQSHGKAYAIFHNSFREYILSKTDNLLQRFNRAFVLFYEQNLHTDEAYRNYFKHLYEMGEYRKIILSTTIDWVKASWRDYRSFDEIVENIDIAVSSCIQINSLSEFIRIVFIKSQVARSRQILEGSSIDFPIMLLNAGENANSERLIWDGDFVLTSKSYFCHYLDKYYKKTGFLLPQSIIQNGLFKVSRDRSKDDIILISKAKALVMGKVKEIFNEIGTLRWIASNQHGRDYQKITASEEENNKKNLQLKLELIEYLYECNKFDDLVSLSKEITDDVILLSSTQIALTKLIIKGDKTSAINLMKIIQFNSVASDDLKQFIVFCSDYLTNDQVISTFPTIEFELPILHEDMINREGGDYSLHKDIITLYEDLKIIWIYNPEAIKLLILNVSILPNPSKNIYNSIFYLSELWYKSRISKLTCEDVTDLAKQALRQLYVSHTPQHNKTNTGLLDYDSSLYFINLDIHKVYRIIFNLISRLMTSIQVEDYVNYWFHLEETLKGYSHYTVALTIAKQLKATPEKSTPDLINRLIHYAEKLVRIEENTYDLTSSIGKVAEVYGICGLKEDFKRIYNELIDVSFGVHDRKDYRASNILEPLEMIHNIEPDKTLMRLSQIFHIQNNLSDAGNGRMHHICVSEFIAFTARIYPELAFQLLEKEERSISREEAFDIVFKQLIKLASSENLRLYLSLAKTIPRWEKGDSRDNHFLELCLSLLRRALQLHNESFTRELLDIVKYNILVELDKPIELSRFTEEFVHTDMSYLDYSLPEPTTKEKVASEDLISFEYKKFMKKLHPIDIGELTTLFENNYPEFENIIRSQYAICLCNNRNQVIRGEYHRLKEVFQDFVASLPSEANPIPERTLTRTIKNFVTMKDQVVNMNQSSMIKLAELIACLNCFIEATSKLFPKNSFSDFLKDRFDEITWVEHILQRVNENHEFVFSKVLSDENLSYLVENVSILNVVSLVNFVDKWIVGRSKSVCLLKIAHRLLKIDPKYSQELKDKVAVDRYDNHIFPRRENGSPLGFEIIDLLRQPDKEFGKSFLLKSYISQYGAYYDDLVFNLDKLMKYHDFFEDGDAINAYFEANLLYNKELSKGLPNKDNEYEFIINHVENLSIAENVIKHHVWLFDYPVVKIRELSLQSVYDLVCFDPELLKILIRYGLESVSDNQVEHSLTVLIAISLRNPEFLLPYKQ
ncbi:MAG: ATP-binding protein [Candidatus Cloacimonetes bacterium]|nr:ATP-binding protein [Candidatus Cloacimonadota bacterium]